MAGFPSRNGTARAEKAKAPKPGMPFDKDTIIMLLHREKGNVSRVADSIGSSRGAVRNFIDRNSDVQEVVKQERERQLDELEKSVFDRAIESQDTTLQLFLLKTQGKSRGYDKDEAKNAAKDIATAAFDFIVSKSKQSTT